MAMYNYFILYAMIIKSLFAVPMDLRDHVDISGSEAMWFSGPDPKDTAPVDLDISIHGTEDSDVPMDFNGTMDFNVTEDVLSNVLVDESIGSLDNVSMKVVNTLRLFNGWKAYGSVYGTPTLTIKNNLCVVEGLVKVGRGNVITQLPAGCRPTKRLIFNLNRHAQTSRVDLTTDGRISFIAGGKTSWISLSGIILPQSGKGKTSNLSLKNGWRAFGREYGTPTYSLQNGNLCIVQGLVRMYGKTHQDWTKAIAVLPAECRPAKRLIFNVNNQALVARVDVDTAGNIMWRGGGRSHTWLSLTGITFSLKGIKSSNLKLQNGWRTYSKGYEPGTYTVNPGYCVVQGLIVYPKDWKSNSNKPIAQLPSECRPTKRLIFNTLPTCYTKKGINQGCQETARVDVKKDGTMYVVGGGLNKIPGTNFLYLSLEGVFISRACTKVPRGCWTIKDRESCLASFDGRSKYYDQRCTWCPRCTYHTHKCEPILWFLNQRRRSTYEISKCGGK